MKIAIYVSSWPPGRVASGIVTYTAQLVSSLRSMGHDVFVLTLDAGETDDRTIDLKAAPEPALSQLWRRVRARISGASSISEAFAEKLSREVGRLVREEGIEVFEIEEAFGWGRPLALRNIVPVVVRLHGPWFLTGRFNDAAGDALINTRRAEQEGVGIAAAHYVTANCKDTLDAVKDHYGLDLPNSTIIPTPIVSATEDMAWNVETCDRNRIFYVGRFDSLKGGDLVLRAFAELAKVNPDLELTFVGPDSGLKVDGETLHFEEFCRRNFSEALRARIDYRGQMSHADLMAMRTSHYLTVIAAQYDTMGYMLLEPMSLGCPLITTAVGGIPEVIEDGRNGLLIPSQDLTAMVSACQKLLDDPDLTARLGRQAWADCSGLYNPDAVARQTVAAYEAATAAFKSS